MLSATDLFTPATAADYLAKMLALANTLGLKTTSWQSGGVARTILAVVANTLAAGDQIVSVFAQGAFLSTAASVTPEGGPGWLDVLASEVYNESRSAASYASGTMKITNAAAGPYGPFAAGTYHVQNPTTKATYHNAASLLINAAGDTFADFVADAAGSASTSAIGTISATVTSLIGVTVTNPAALVGADADSNAQLVTRCRLKLASFAQRTGPTDAYVYFALNAQSYLSAGSVLAGGAITRARASGDATTGVVTVTIANGAGAPAGGDVTLVNGVLQAQCVPDAVTCVTQAATNKSITVIFDLWAPTAVVTPAITAALTAVTNYLARCPIGGLSGSGGSHVLSFEGLVQAALAAAVAAGASADSLDASCTLNGAAADVVLTAVEVPTLNGASVFTAHGT